MFVISIDTPDNTSTKFFPNSEENNAKVAWEETLEDHDYLEEYELFCAFVKVDENRFGSMCSDLDAELEGGVTLIAQFPEE